MSAQPIVIDTRMHRREKITACFVVAGEATALVETGPKSSVDHVLKGLEKAGVEHLDYIVVTHIHLDHAGAAGTLAAHFADATVCVHEVGAPHLADPSKLWSSAARIYGHRMDELWGGIDPVPNDRIRVLVDGDKIDLGGRNLEAVDTPGHARHHHAYLDDATGTVFVGDALGVRLPDVGVIRPATPPPEFNLDEAIASINKIRGLGAGALWLTHFGDSGAGESPRDVDEMCDAGIASLRQWNDWVVAARSETRELDDAAALVRAEARAALENSVPDAALDRMEQTTSYWMNTWGYMRYLDKKENPAP
jgi:glyoxylase-like metal-dependent hydrolase (beta-lactamase superfamily II)